MANRNRKAGHDLERDVVRKLRDMGYEADTSRYASRKADDSGVDIVSDFSFKIQCKASINQPNCHQLLTEKDCDLIVFRKMEKQGSRFYSKGDYAMLKLEDLFNLIKQKR